MAGQLITGVYKVVWRNSLSGGHGSSPLVAGLARLFAVAAGSGASVAAGLLIAA
jgi:hypothetical protein